MVLSGIDLFLSTVFPDLAGADEGVVEGALVDTSVVNTSASDTTDVADDGVEPVSSGGQTGASALQGAREEVLGHALVEALAQVELLTAEVQRLQTRK